MSRNDNKWHLMSVFLQLPTNESENDGCVVPAEQNG
jgi:hypothetical protein